MKWYCFHKICLDFLKRALYAARLCSTIDSEPMTIREAIQAELKKRGWSLYRFAKELEGKMPARTVYAFLGNECDLVSDRVSMMLEALEMTIKTEKFDKLTLGYYKLVDKEGNL